ncbi:MAG: dipeptide ABC transporter ATP-binding protein [Pseudomonadota bacterium]
MALLQIENLELSIRDIPVLKDVGLQVDAGEVVGVVGESGSGKSMTAMAIMQLLPVGSAWSGSVRFDGNALETFTEDDMCALRGNDIAMVFQEPMTALNPVQTIGDQVAETILVHSGKSRSESRQMARQALNRVGLPEDQFPLDRYPHDLSGGQRQRVVIAMAIALRPKLLIADEPTTALDVTTQAQILKLLKKLVDEDGMGLVLITHDLAVVAEMADHIVIMKDGAVVEEGDTLELFRRMKHPYTKALFEASNHVPHRNPVHVDGRGEPIIEVWGVVRDYPLPRRSLFRSPGHFRAVDHVSMAISRGENVGLVGESGCGKSTLTRAILALDPVQAGEIRLDGTPFSSSTAEPDRSLRRRIQVVFQDPYSSFNPRHRVERLIAEPFHLLDQPPSADEKRRRIEAALTNVGLSASDADRYIHEFSGGQRQRIAIARALIIEPELIVLDEAVSALDVSIRAQILDLLADLSDRLAISYLFISHDLSVVRAITDRVLVMKSGRVVEEGWTEEVFRNPQHAYTRQLLAATPILDDALKAREARTVAAK